MANTIIIYQGDGSTTDFAVPFDYLRKSFVKVLLNSVTELKGGSATDTSADYYFVDATTIRLRKIVPTTAQTITIRRYTSVKERVASFRDGSVLYAKDLDTSQVQAFHIAEEARDVINDALVVDRDDNWDARGKRIINVGNPEEATDAVTLGVYKADALGAYQSKIGAENARDRAIVAETNAKNSEDNAKVSETNAKSSEETAISASDQALASANNASSSASVATEKATASATSAREAKTSEDNAATYKDSAGTSAAMAKASEDEAKRQADLAKSYANQAALGQFQSDWNQTDDTQKDYIKNKPNLGVYATTTALTEGLSGKADKSHTHTVSNVIGLQDALNNKLDVTTFEGFIDYGDLGTP